MHWNMSVYPDSMKNFDPLVRKRAIDIANALEVEGYAEDRLIPFAQSQAQEWFDNASSEEKKAFEQEENPSKTDKHEANANIDLVDNDVEVFYENDIWKVKTKEAIERAEEMIRNK